MLLKEVMKDKFKREWNKIVDIEPLLFGSFVPTVFPDGDTSKKPMIDLYCELTDRDKVKVLCENELGNYNSVNH